MKRTFTLLAAALVLLTSACTKDDSDEEIKAESTWTVDGVKHTSAYSAKTTTSGADPRTLILFFDKTPSEDRTQKMNTFNLSFKGTPTASGKYQLVTNGTADIKANQFELFGGYGSIAEAGTPTGDSYAYAYFGPNIDVTVTVTNGKVKVVIPEITVKNTNSTKPDLKVSASVQEL